MREHDARVHVFGSSISLRATQGRMVLQFIGRPATLEIVDVIPEPRVDPVAPVAPSASVTDLEAEPEEDDAGIAPFDRGDYEGRTTDEDSD